MTAVVPSRGELEARRPAPPAMGPKGNIIYKVLTTTDHKLIGIMYVVACFTFFVLAGLMALFMRAELAVPGLQFLSNEQYNQLFTMHGTAMLLFYATPVVFGFANLVMPLQIGAPDVAFPRLNALSLWLFIFGALIALGGFITPGGAADFGWTVYVPLSDAVHSPGAGADLWILGVAVGGLGTILGRGQHDHHGRLHALSRHDDVPDADLHLEHLHHQHPGHPDLPAAHRRRLRPGCRPSPRCAHLRPGQRRRDAVPAPVLVLRSPRGVRPRAAVLRHRLRGLPGVLPQADLRLLHAGLRHHQHRGAVHGGVGPPHVRHRCGSAAVLLVHDVPDRGAHRHQVLQLDRHHVEGQADLRVADAVRLRVPGDLPAAVACRECCWPARRWTSTCPTPTSWSPTSTTCCSA